METVEGDEEIEVPHARGPEEIGMEDMGPQRQTTGHGIDIEAAVGRPAVGHTEVNEVEIGEGREEAPKEEEKKDGEDTVITDADAEVDAKGEEEAKTEEKKDGEMPDAEPATT
jgi:hypothetical protein